MTKPTNFFTAMADPLLHMGGGFLLSVPMLFTGTPLPVMIYAMVLLGLFRELAQDNKSNLIAAIRDFPSWTIQHHAEWLAWGLGPVLLTLAWRVA